MRAFPFPFSLSLPSPASAHLPAQAADPEPPAGSRGRSGAAQAGPTRADAAAAAARSRSALRSSPPLFPKLSAFGIKTERRVARLGTETQGGRGRGEEPGWVGGHRFPGPAGGSVSYLAEHRRRQVCGSWTPLPVICKR